MSNRAKVWTPLKCSYCLTAESFTVPSSSISCWMNFIKDPLVNNPNICKQISKKKNANKHDKLYTYFQMKDPLIHTISARGMKRCNESASSLIAAFKFNCHVSANWSRTTRAIASFPPTCKPLLACRIADLTYERVKPESNLLYSCVITYCSF